MVPKLQLPIPVNPPRAKGAHPWLRVLMFVGLLWWRAPLNMLASETNTLAWPPPPANPYVVYVRTISAPKDIGVRASFFTRLGNTLTGVGKDAKKMERPFGLTLDDADNLVITDTSANSVDYLDLAGKKWRHFTSSGGKAFLSPVAAVHHGKTFFVADSAAGKVIAFDEKGKEQFVITNELARPSGLAILGGKLLIADSQLHQVILYDLTGQFISKFGQRGKGEGEFNFPTHVSVDTHSQIYVTDSLNHRIQVFAGDGKYLRSFGSVGDGPGHFSRPKGVAVDRSGHVYVVDAVFNNVQIFDDHGRLLLDFSEPGSEAGKLCLPNAIAINSKNEIFVADAYNHRIQEFRYTGRE